MSFLPPSYDLVLAVQSKHRLSSALLSCREPMLMSMLIMLSIVLAVNILRMHP